MEKFWKTVRVSAVAAFCFWTADVSAHGVETYGTPYRNAIGDYAGYVRQANENSARDSYYGPNGSYAENMYRNDDGVWSHPRNGYPESASLPYFLQRGGRGSGASWQSMMDAGGTYRGNFRWDDRYQDGWHGHDRWDDRGSRQYWIPVEIRILE